MVYFWFRRDLRLEDNVALHHALKDHEEVQCIFIFDKELLSKLPYKKDPRLAYIHQNLKAIKTQLNTFGSDLRVEYGEVLDVWKSILLDGDIIYANKDYEQENIIRDEKIANYLSEIGGEWNAFKDHVIFEESEILNGKGEPYTVFTPYAKKWMLMIKEAHLKEYFYDQTHFYKNENLGDIPSLESMGFEEVDLREYDLSPNYLAIKNYAETRDIPSIKNGTSRVGIGLRMGTISIRRLVKMAFSESEPYLIELIWREFFMQIFFHFPESATQSFRREYDEIAWRNNEEDFDKWCRGETGYALVDAGMRELNATGFMHNRVRMLVASFLCKNLLIHWSWGEAYFASKLVDYERSSNVGNWQWAAGTGCDAAPYFRIFSPDSQLDKFDKERKYIAQWCPEYLGEDAPKMLVDWKYSRLRALETYKSGLEKARSRF